MDSRLVGGVGGGNTENFPVESNKRNGKKVSPTEINELLQNAQSTDGRPSIKLNERGIGLNTSEGVGRTSKKVQTAAQSLDPTAKVRREKLEEIIKKGETILNRPSLSLDGIKEILKGIEGMKKSDTYNKTLLENEDLQERLKALEISLNVLKSLKETQSK